MATRSGVSVLGRGNISYVVKMLNCYKIIFSDAGHRSEKESIY